MIKLIAFDIGNVLFRIDHSQAWELTLADTELTPEVAYERFYHSGDMIESMIGQLDDDTFFKRLRDKLRYKRSPDDLRQIWSQTIHPIPERIQVATSLGSQYRLALISNTSPFHSNQVDLHPNFTEHFDPIVYSWKCGYMKPRRECFEDCLKHTPYSASECLFIDDQERQTEAATDLGWQTLTLSLEDDLERRLASIGIEIPANTPSPIQI